jgi:hypothetical protein
VAQIIRQRGSGPGRHHVGTPGDFISECLGDFIGIRTPVCSEQIGRALFAFEASWHSSSLSQKRIIQSDRIFTELTMATWIKCTNTKKMPVYINLDNAVTVMRDDTGERINERGTVIEFMGKERVYIVVTEQPEEIIQPKSSA